MGVARAESGEEGIARSAIYNIKRDGDKTGKGPIVEPSERTSEVAEGRGAAALILLALNFHIQSCHPPNVGFFPSFPSLSRKVVAPRASSASHQPRINPTCNSVMPSSLPSGSPPSSPPLSFPRALRALALHAPPSRFLRFAFPQFRAAFSMDWIF